MFNDMILLTEPLASQLAQPPPSSSLCLSLLPLKRRQRHSLKKSAEYKTLQFRLAVYFSKVKLEEEGAEEGTSITIVPAQNEEEQFTSLVLHMQNKEMRDLWLEDLKFSVESENKRKQFFDGEKNSFMIT